MASYTISTAVTTAGAAQTINTGDTVTVTSSGSLNGTGTAGVGIYSSNTGGASGGFDTLSISGTVRGGLYGFWDAGNSGNDTVTVNAGGSIFGGYNAGDGAAVYIEAGSNTINNAGQIVDNLGAYGVYVSAGGNTITNSGTISTTGDSAIYIDGGFNTITNSGKVASGGDYAIDLTGSGGDSGHNVVSNSGTATGYYGFLIEEGSNTVTNTGTISTSYTAIEVTGDGNSVTNSGSISASSDYGVELDGNSSSVSNTGTISAEYGVYIDGTANVVDNKASGTISGTSTGIYADTGASAHIVNAGAVIGGSYGMDLESVTAAHIKVTGTGTVTGGDYGIYAYGADPTSDVAVNVKGAVQGGTYGIWTYYSDNTIRVGSHGSVVGTTDAGIYNEDGGNTHVFNAGAITGGDYGIYITGDANHIHNNGTITGISDSGIYIDGSTNHITNGGTISGTEYGIDISGGSNTIINLSSGLIKGAATDTGDDGIYFADAANSVTNSGSIVVATHGTTDVAAIYAGSGSNVITNNAGGLISDFHGAQTSNYAIELNDGSNVVTNNGKIVGTVQIGTSGTNTYDGSGGHLKGTVIGGDGVDTIILGAGHSGAEGGSGADSITVGSGSDNLIYTAVGDSYVSSFDSVDGFVAGTDTFTFDLGGNAFTGLSSVTVSSLSGVSTTAIQNAVAGHLDPYGAVALSVSTGLYAGDVFLIVDADGTPTFSSSDYLVVLTHLSGTLTASDIITT